MLICGAENQTQGLVHVRQMLYLLSYTHSPMILSIFIKIQIIFQSLIFFISFRIFHTIFPHCVCQIWCWLIEDKISQVGGYLSLNFILSSSIIFQVLFFSFLVLGLEPWGLYPWTISSVLFKIFILRQSPTELLKALLNCWS